jgi:DeoR/GlpR family transcriptional regulator of sugar metabolism
MLAKERRDNIKKKLDQDLTVSVNDLASDMNVTMETIRKDLDILANDDSNIIRIHGGAYRLQPAKNNPYYHDFKNDKIIEENKKISKLAADQICENDVVMLDSSMKSFFIAKELVRRNITATVITNSLPSANIISTSKNLTLFCLGGNLNFQTYSFKGNFTLETLKNMHSDKAFLSPTAISKDFGISHLDEFEAQIAKAMIDNSNKVYLVMQNSKFDKATLTRIGAISDIDTIISYKHLSDKWEKCLEKNNVDSICFKL